MTRPSSEFDQKHPLSAADYTQTSFVDPLSLQKANITSGVPSKVRAPVQPNRRLPQDLRARIPPSVMQKIDDEKYTQFGFLYEQPVLDGDPLDIGPLRYSHSMRRISIAEEKSVDAVPTTRSNRNFLVQSGLATQVANIELIFTGIDEINEGLRPLLALFRIAPIISLQNELLSACWYTYEDFQVRDALARFTNQIGYNQEKFNELAREAYHLANQPYELDATAQSIGDMLRTKPIFDIVGAIRSGSFYSFALSKISGPLKTKQAQKTVDQYFERQIGAGLAKNKDGIGGLLPITALMPVKDALWHAVALSGLSLQNVPDTVDTIQVFLRVHRVDLSSVTPNGDLEYLTYTGSGSVDPRNATWLKKWLDQCTESIPTVTSQELGYTRIKWYETTIGGKDWSGRRLSDVFEFQDSALIQGISCTLQNRFAFQKLIGKGVPSAQHIGSTARSMSLDILFDTQDKAAFREFMRFKEVGDTLARSDRRIDRATGWSFTNGLLKLLSTWHDAPQNADYSENGIFVPLYLSVDTADVPHLKRVSVDLLENNVDFMLDQEILINDGATPKKTLRAFFMETMAEDAIFRNNRALKSTETLAALSSNTPENASLRRGVDSFFWVWPGRRQYTENTKTLVEAQRFITDSGPLTEGIFNIDTLRAVFLTGKLDPDGKLVQALRNDPVVVGSYREFDLNRFDITRALQDVYRFFGLDGNPQSRLVRSLIFEQVQRLFPEKQQPDNLLPVQAVFNPYSPASSLYLARALQTRLDKITDLILASYYAPTSRLNNDLVFLLRDSAEPFHPDFLEALFEVVCDRPAPPVNLENLYQMDGLHDAFFALFSAYMTQGQQSPAVKKLNEANGTDAKRIDFRSEWRRTNYPDIPLPSYQKLFGDLWHDPKFAPTYSDLGLRPELASDQTTFNADSDNDEAIAVGADDIVHPAAFYYRERNKPSIRANLRNPETLAFVQQESNRMSMSLAFNVDITAELDKVRGLLPTATQKPVTKVAGTVEQVVDGDTFTVMLDGRKETVRVLGINAPEVAHSEINRFTSKTYNEPGGLESKDVLTELLQGQTVILSNDSYQSNRDTYGRLLRHVDVSSYASNGQLTDVGSFMLSAGTGVKKFNYIHDRGFGEQAPENANQILKSLEQIVRESLEFQRRNDPSAFASDLAKARAMNLNEQFRQKYLSENAWAQITFNIHNQKNLGILDKVESKLLTSIYYKVLSEAQWFNSPQVSGAGGQEGVQSYKSVNILTEEKFMRNLPEHTMQTVESSLSQVTDDHKSMVRCFPAMRFYLIDRRGTDLLCQDAMFNVSNVISMDITQDKDDADLAVIRIADPMMVLQQDYFENRNSAVADNGEKVVLGPATDQGFMKRLKIAQGRAVQIRMGYDAYPENLKVIFTGRITEIVPGDVVTIVAQGWKAELVNRQVSFSLSHPEYWSVHDLAVQTMLHANPDGFGTHYPQNNVDFYLTNKELFNPDLVQRVLAFNKTSPGTAPGLSSVSPLTYLPIQAGNFVASLVGGVGYNQERANQGLDTRLKNIWVADVDLSGWSNWYTSFGVAPYFMSNGWVVPSQPAWEVMKEAARHGFNTVAQVVPYDTDATLFFGTPDMPYYYTRGSHVRENVIRNYRRKTLQAARKKLMENLEQYRNGFVNSPQYGNATYLRDGFYDTANIADSFYTWLADVPRTLAGEDTTSAQIKFLREGDVFTDLDQFGAWANSQPGYKSVMGRHYPKGVQGMRGLGSNFVMLSTLISRGSYGNGYSVPGKVDSSNKPGVAFTQLHDFFGEATVPLVMLLGYGVNPEDLQLAWPTYASDFPELLRPGAYRTSDYGSRIESILGKIQESVGSYSSFGLVQFATNSGYRTAIHDASGAFLHYETYISNYTEEADNAKKRGLKNSLKDTLKETGLQLKAFVYYLSEYFQSEQVRNTPEAQAVLAAVRASTKASMDPRKQVFRVHHWVDNDADILQNQIAATTKEMHNTVLIEHPQSKVTLKESDDGNPRRLQAGVEWVYWPRNEMSQVIGLQFHPGLTLSNKKIKVCTEMNALTPSTSAKLACVHLADGIRRMYRGTLAIRGRHIKPYDRIILNDRYSDMRGPLEVESVVHHWSVETGWVSNIIPQAVCDANAGAAILQTAVLEEQMERIMGAIEKVSDWLFYAALIGTVASGGALAAGAAGIRSGLGGLIRTVGTVLGNGVTSPIRTTRFVLGNTTRTLGAATDALLKDGIAPRALWRNMMGSIGGVPEMMLATWGLGGMASTAVRLGMQHSVFNSFVQNAQSSGGVEQLPVTLSPLMSHGIPFTAGLEAEDILFSSWVYDSYRSFADINAHFWRALPEIMRQLGADTDVNPMEIRK